MITPDIVLFAGVAFLVGAIPFSLWIGFLFLGVDIRHYGDGNPGTFNVIRAGGIAWGALALILDISKGAAPVGIAAQVWGIDGWPLVWIAIMPVLGHAFSPFLAFKGGKAIATSGGVLIGLSLWKLPLIGGCVLVFWYVILTSSGWAVMFTATTLIVSVLVMDAPQEWFIILLLMTLLMIVKHRRELIQLPKIRRFRP
jgi:glycerol-3-phosphate acyltransferase PlsY